MKFNIVFIMGWVTALLDKKIKRELRKRYNFNNASLIHLLILIVVFVISVIIDIRYMSLVKKVIGL